MLKEFLFETNLGNRLLAILERTTGLAVVDAEWLAQQEAPGMALTIPQGSDKKLLQPFVILDYTIIDIGPQLPH